MSLTSAASAGSHTSPSLLARVRAAEPQAWQRLVALYEPLVRCWCRRAQLQETDAADVCQEVFCAVTRHVDGFRAQGEGSFRRWLWVVTRSKLNDHFRRIAGRARGEGGTEGQLRLAEIPDAWGDPQSDPQTNAVLDAVRQRALDQVRAQFEPATWNAFWLVTIEEQSVADAARALSMTVGAVYKAKSRVLNRLRAELCEIE
jgi:RNA polymerase sigma-70 factor (ECF subfamily)